MYVPFVRLRFIVCCEPDVNEVCVLLADHEPLKFPYRMHMLSLSSDGVYLKVTFPSFCAVPLAGRSNFITGGLVSVVNVLVEDELDVLKAYSEAFELLCGQALV